MDDLGSTYSDDLAEAFGAVIRRRRLGKRPPMTQQRLGELADYKEGAGVSISRIENGKVRPPSDRLAAIADALGTTEGELRNDAHREARERLHAAQTASVPGTQGARRGNESLKSRYQRVVKRAEDRRLKLESAIEELTEAQSRSRDEFILPFVTTAEGIEGLPLSDLPSSPGEETDMATNAQERVDILSVGITNALRVGLVGAAGGAVGGGALGGAGAYGAFTLTALMGTASTGAPIAGLTGIAASNATFAALGGGALSAGGAGIAGGTALLAGIAAAPVALLAIGGAVFMVRRNKRKEAEAHNQLDEYEQFLDRTDEGFRSLVRRMKRVAEIESDIATFAGRELTKWQRKVGAERPLQWSALSADVQEAFGGFVSAAACKMMLDTLKWEPFVDPEQQADLQTTMAAADAVIDKAMEIVEEVV